MKPSFNKIINTNHWLYQSLFKSSLKTGFTLIFAVSVSGCWAPSIKPAAYEITNLSNILVVPVESPPMEIIPDPIEERIPAYGHYRNMCLNVPLETKLYKTSGDVVIAGLVYPGDDEREVTLQKDNSSPNLTIATGAGQVWSPTLILAQQAKTELARHHIKAVLNSHYYRLDMPDADRDAHLNHWRDAISAWYAQSRSVVDYQSQAGHNAVLELGLGNYRVFEGQTSVQVLMKLINPRTGQVIARTREETFTGKYVGQNSLNRNSEAFKQRFSEMGLQLLIQGLQDIGLQQADATTQMTE